jgi:hypothetical protein
MTTNVARNPSAFEIRGVVGWRRSRFEGRIAGCDAAAWELSVPTNPA